MDHEKKNQEMTTISPIKAQPSSGADNTTESPTDQEKTTEDGKTEPKKKPKFPKVPLPGCIFGADGSFVPVKEEEKDPKGKIKMAYDEAIKKASDSIEAFLKHQEDIPQPAPPVEGTDWNPNLTDGCAANREASKAIAEGLLKACAKKALEIPPLEKLAETTDGAEEAEKKEEDVVEVKPSMQYYYDRSRSTSRNRNSVRNQRNLYNYYGGYADSTKPDYAAIRQKDFKHLCPLIGVKDYIYCIGLYLSSVLNQKESQDQTRELLKAFYDQHGVFLRPSKEDRDRFVTENTAQYRTVVRSWGVVRDIILRDYNLDMTPLPTNDDRFNRLISVLEFLSNIILKPNIITESEQCTCDTTNDLYVKTATHVSTFTEKYLDRIVFQNGSVDIVCGFPGSRTKLAIAEI